MANGNMWDHSGIILANRGGANLAMGMAGLGDGIRRGIEDHRRKVKEKEAEDAAVAWMQKNGQALGLNVGDAGELKAAVKAAGGGRQAIQMISALETQKQQRAAAAQQQQVTAAHLQEAGDMRQQRLRNAGATRLAAGGRAGNDELGALLANGAQFADVSAGPPGSPEEMAMRQIQLSGDPGPSAGVAEVLTRLDAMRQGREQFQPQLVDLGGGVSGMTTSARSAVPIERGPSKSPQSPQGKLLADAADLEKKGFNDEAAALRKMATSTKSGAKPMALQDFMITGGDPSEYRAYVEDFYSKTKEGGSNEGPQVTSQAKDEFTKGARVRQGGKVYEYDGKTWKEIAS